MARRFVLHAPNVHQGGGATLLRGLLSDLPAVPGQLILDRRFPFETLPAGYTLHRVAPTLFSRLRAERLLARTTDVDTQTLCFSGLPPLFQCAGHVAVFVQNLNLVADTDLSGFTWKQRQRIRLERMWFRRCAANADEFLVQTATMHDLLRETIGSRTPVRIQPFAPPAAKPATVPAHAKLGGRPIRERLFALGRTATKYDFCYVATGEPNKNHRRLVEAWRLLWEEGRRPSLCVTVSPDLSPELAEWIARQVRDHGLCIDNVGYVSREDVDALYRHSQRLIFPSLYESFGLPLIEAAELGLPIIAAERDYVRDVAVPEHTFDPESARSIARAVARSLGQTDALPAVASPREFLSEVLAA